MPPESPVVTDAQAALLDEIASLLTEPEAGAPRPSLASIEYTLTSGYARALELEAERWRLDRQMGEVRARFGDGNGSGADELAELAVRATRTDGELARLRKLLVSLRSQASAMRAAGAAIFF
jgi:hypothetical protein